MLPSMTFEVIVHFTKRNLLHNISKAFIQSFDKIIIVQKSFLKKVNHEIIDFFVRC